MPATVATARRFNPTLHPRDRKGRFTRSSTRKLKARDRSRAHRAMAKFKPRKGISGAGASAYLTKILGGRDGAPARRYLAENGFVEVNETLRAGKTSPEVKALKAAMFELPDDIIATRRVPLAMLGDAEPDDLVDYVIRDAAPAPVALKTVPAAEGFVRMRIAVPKGTRATVHPDTGQLVLDTDLDLAVASAQANTAGGWDMHLVALPRTDDEPDGDDTSAPDAPARPDTGDATVAGIGQTEPGVADVVAPGTDDAETALRAELMRLRVAELQQRARERGLKPGKARKTALVDLILADERGDGTEPDMAPADGLRDSDIEAGELVVDALPGDPRPPAQRRVAAVVKQLMRDKDREWVAIADVRERLVASGMTDRAEQDDAIRALSRMPLAHVEPVANMKGLTQRDRDAAVTIGGEPSHMVMLEPGFGDDDARDDTDTAGATGAQRGAGADRSARGGTGTADDELSGESDAAGTGGTGGAVSRSGRRGSEDTTQLHQVHMDAARAVAELAAEVEEHVAKQASARAITHRLRARLRRMRIEHTDDGYVWQRPGGDVPLGPDAGLRSASAAEQAELDAAVRLATLAGEIEDLVAGGASAGDITAAVRARVADAQLEPLGRAGETVTFDPGQHDTIGPVRAGARAEVVRPGYRWRELAGDVIVERPVVQALGRPEQVSGRGTPAASPALRARITELEQRLATVADEARPIADEIARRLQSRRVGGDDTEYYRRLRRLKELGETGSVDARALLDALVERDGAPWGGDPTVDERWQPARGVQITTGRDDGPLTFEQQVKLRDQYVVNDRNTITQNASLRSGNPSAAAKAWAKRMRTLVRSAELARDTVLHRGAALRPEQVIALRPGSVMHDRGIVSTATGPDEAEQYANTRLERLPGTIKTLFEIRAPAGTSATSVGYGEVVLDYDQRYRIVSTRLDENGNVRVVIELVGGESQ